MMNTSSARSSFSGTNKYLVALCAIIAIFSSSSNSSSSRTTCTHVTAFSISPFTSSVTGTMMMRRSPKSQPQPQLQLLRSNAQIVYASSDYLDGMETNWGDGDKNKGSGSDDGDGSGDSTSKGYLDNLKTKWEDTDADADSSKDYTKLIQNLLITASSTDRGQFASQEQKSKMEQIITELETSTSTSTSSGSIPNPTESPSIEGTWELLYSSTQLFRSSPFFMAGRAVCTTPEQAQQYDWFCDMHRAALAISEIGTVRQIISSTRITSEFEVHVGSVPFLSDFTPLKYSGGLPFTITGAIVSSADITPVNDGSAWEIFMDTVEIKGSNIPLLRRVLDDGLKLSSRELGSFLEENVEQYSNPKPVFETTYLDDMLRISRDQDGKVFVYGKMSDGTEPTSYKSVDADLGLLNLLEGLNDNFFKISI